MVYDEMVDAKQACDKLNGFNFMGRYLVVLYHQPEKMVKSLGEGTAEERKERLDKVKKDHGID